MIIELATGQNDRVAKMSNVQRAADSQLWVRGCYEEQFLSTLWPVPPIELVSEFGFV